MDKRARELDEAFVKRAILGLRLRQPERLQYLVRFKVVLPIKTGKVAQVTRIVLAGTGHAGYHPRRRRKVKRGAGRVRSCEELVTKIQ